MVSDVAVGAGLAAMRYHWPVPVGIWMYWFAVPVKLVPVPVTTVLFGVATTVPAPFAGASSGTSVGTAPAVVRHMPFPCVFTTSASHWTRWKAKPLNRLPFQISSRQWFDGWTKLRFIRII